MNNRIKLLLIIIVNYINKLNNLYFKNIKNKEKLKEKEIRIFQLLILFINK
jgi:hypothetical protein